MENKLGNVAENAAMHIRISGASGATIHTVGQMGGEGRQARLVQESISLYNHSFSGVWQGDKLTGLFCHLFLFMGPPDACPIRGKHLSPTIHCLFPHIFPSPFPLYLRSLPPQGAQPPFTATLTS